MTNSTSISVIIPVYNRQNTIVDCIESVLAQTVPANEIIIIDDGSTDDTLKRLTKFGDQVTVLKTDQRSGAQVARNIGIKAAHSDWIAFLDSDDQWLPNKLELQLSVLKSVNYDLMTVVHGDCLISKNKSGSMKLWQLDKLDGQNVYQQLLSRSGTFFPAILTSMQALKGINYLDENVLSYQEWDTAIQLAKICRFIHVQEPLFIYNIHSDTISKNSNISIDGYQYILNKYRAEIISNCGNEVLNQHFITNSVIAINNNYKYSKRIIAQIHGKVIKKSILYLFSYLRIKPIYFTRVMQIFSWKK